MERIAGEMGGVMDVVSVDVDEGREIAGRYRVRSIPAFLVFKDGRVADQFVGFRPGMIRSRLAAVGIE